MFESFSTSEKRLFIEVQSHTLYAAGVLCRMAKAAVATQTQVDISLTIIHMFCIYFYRLQCK